MNYTDKAAQIQSDLPKRPNVWMLHHSLHELRLKIFQLISVAQDRAAGRTPWRLHPTGSGLAAIRILGRFRRTGTAGCRRFPSGWVTHDRASFRSRITNGRRAILKCSCSRRDYHWRRCFCLDHRTISVSDSGKSVRG